MGALASNQVYDLASIAKILTPGKFNIGHIAWLLSQSNEPVLDIPWIPANMPLGHLITLSTGLPTTFTKQLNQLVSVSRGQTAQVTEGMSIFENWMEIDHDELAIFTDKGKYLYAQALQYIESMTQSWANSFFYGDPSSNPTQFLGLAPRYSTVNTANAQNAKNVIDQGGTGSTNASIWLLTYGETALHGIYPEGSPAGIQHFVNADQVIQGTTGFGGTRGRAHQEQWQWKCGLALWDWRWCARACNIDVPSLRNQAGAADLTEAMIDLENRLPSLSTPPLETGNPMTSNAIPGKRTYVMNRTLRVGLEKQMLSKTNNQLTMEDWYGKKVMHFRGIPIRCSDQLLNTEARVV